MKGSKLENRRQAFLYPGLYRRKGGMAPHFVGLVAIGFRAARRWSHRSARCEARESSGSRVLVFMYWLQKSVRRILSHVRKVSREAIRANVG